MSRLLLLIAAVAIVAAACGGAGGSVATVNGESIDFGDVQSLQYDEKTELSPEEFGQLLDVYIAWTAFSQEATSQFGIDPDDSQIQARIGRVLADAGAADQELFLEAQNISGNGLRLTVTQMLIEDGLEAALAPSVRPIPAEEAQAAITGRQADYTEVCLAHILVETEQEALDVIEQVGQGADFGELAGQVSLDPSSSAAGGQLGCSVASQFVPEFAEASLLAPVGEIFGPVESGFGYHVMRVDSRDAASVEDVLVDLQQEAVFEAIDAWYGAVLAAAEVAVDPAYGVWQSGATARLVPPEG